MKKYLYSVISAALCISLVITPFVLVASAYADEAITTDASEIYIGDNYVEDYDITPFERGYCTDSYSKAWCDSHGFANNRPVPHQVKLNAKEEACLRELYIAGTASVIAELITQGPGGGLFATAMVSFNLFNCMF